MELIQSPGLGRIRDKLIPPFVSLAHRKTLGSIGAKEKIYLTGRRSPHPEAHGAIVPALSAEGHVMTTIHWALPSFRSYGAPSELPESGPAADLLRPNHEYRLDAIHSRGKYPSSRPSASRA